MSIHAVSKEAVCERVGKGWGGRCNLAALRPDDASDSCQAPPATAHALPEFVVRLWSTTQ